MPMASHGNGCKGFAAPWKRWCRNSTRGAWCRITRRNITWRSSSERSGAVDRFAPFEKSLPMSNEIIYPRSPRETMCGWMHLPRYIDKIRLHLAGKLHADYAANFGKGFDGRWLEAAALKHEQFIEVVKNSVSDGEI